MPPPFPSRVSAWSVYDTFTLAGDEQLFIGAVSDKQFEALCQVLGRDDLLADPQMASNALRVERRPELVRTLGETLATVQAEALVPRLEAAGIPYAPVVRPDQLVEDPHLIASGGLVDMVNEDDSTSQVVLLPLLLGGRRPGVRMKLPAIGEHTDEVLATLPR